MTEGSMSRSMGKSILVDSLLVMSSTLRRRSVPDGLRLHADDRSTREDPARSACTSDAVKKVIEFTWARSASSSRASERLRIGCLLGYAGEGLGDRAVHAGADGRQRAPRTTTRLRCRWP